MGLGKPGRLRFDQPTITGELRPAPDAYTHYSPVMIAAWIPRRDLPRRCDAPRPIWGRGPIRAPTCSCAERLPQLPSAPDGHSSARRVEEGTVLFPALAQSPEDSQEQPG
jgi:hypothetical protein